MCWGERIFLQQFSSTYPNLLLLEPTERLRSHRTHTKLFCDRGFLEASYTFRSVDKYPYISALLEIVARWALLLVKTDIVDKMTATTLRPRVPISGVFGKDIPTSHARYTLHSFVLRRCWRIIHIFISRSGC